MDNFYILTNDTNNTKLISLTALNKLEFNQTCNVAYEPLENGQFSSDSKQVSPFNLPIVATKMPIADTPMTTDEMNTVISDTINALRTLEIGTQIVKIVSRYQVFGDLILTTFNFKRDAARDTGLWAELTFQQIRMTTTQTAVLPASKVSNKQNASPTTSGQQQTQDTSVLAKNFPNLGVYINNLFGTPSQGIGN